jgi:hypothetical protein
MTNTRKSSSFPLRLSPSLRADAERLARAEGVSLNQFIALTLAEKLGAANERAFFEARRQRADVADLRAALTRADGEPPRDGDRIER